jgi:hypothetical protein
VAGGVDCHEWILPVCNTVMVDDVSDFACQIFDQKMTCSRNCQQVETCNRLRAAAFAVEVT